MRYMPLIYTSPLLTAVFWLSFTAFCLNEAWVWMRERGGTKGENRDRGSKAWVMGFNVLGFWLAFAFMFSLPGAAVHRHAHTVFAVGIALVLLGVWLRNWAIRTLGKFFRTSVIIQGDHRMITTGPYRYVRNPSYSGAVVTFAGIGLAMGNWASLAAIVTAGLVSYWRRIAVEQQALTEHFGQPYRDYIARTWALIPFVW